MAVYDAILGWLPAAWSQETFIISEDNTTYEVPVVPRTGQCLRVLPEERWGKYCDPVTERCWYWAPESNSCFWADAPPSDWTPYWTDDGRLWWWNEETYAFFYDERARNHAIRSEQVLAATERR